MLLCISFIALAFIFNKICNVFWVDFNIWCKYGLKLICLHVAVFSYSYSVIPFLKLTKFALDFVENKLSILYNL